MNDEQTVRRWFAHVDTERPIMRWLFERALRTRAR